MFRKFITILSICLLLSQVFTESNENFVLATVSPNQGFLQPKLSANFIDKIIKCGTTLKDVVKRAVPIMADIIVNPLNFFKDLSKIFASFQEVTDVCTEIFDISPIEKLSTQFSSKRKFEGIPSISTIIDCIKTIKPLATDILNAVTNFKDGDVKAGLDNVEQASIDVVNLGFTCYKVIEEILN